MDYQGYTIIARTNGTEPSLDLEFSPASGSAFPIDVIFFIRSIVNRTKYPPLHGDRSL